MKKILLSLFVSLIAWSSHAETASVDLTAKGYTNAQIAQELYISVDTVKKHMYVIFEKLEIESRKDLKSFFS